jgi:hypothetical protein
MRTLLSVLLVMTIFATLGLAADKPNFSGEWTADMTKSDFGPMGPPQSYSRKIDHAEPAISYTEATVGGPQGDQTITLKCTTDGKETDNELMGNPLKLSSKWDGDTLVMTAKADFQGNEITLADKWSLSPDGKVLTVARHIAMSQGEFDVTYVLNKK